MRKIIARDCLRTCSDNHALLILSSDIGIVRSYTVQRARKSIYSAIGSYIGTQIIPTLRTYQNVRYQKIE